MLGNTQTPCELPARRHHGPMAAPRSNMNTQTASSSCPWSGLCPSRVGFPPCGAEGDIPWHVRVPRSCHASRATDTAAATLCLAQHLKTAQIPPGGDDSGCFISVPTPCGPHTHQEDEAVQEQGVEEGHGPSGLVGQDEPPLQKSRVENPISVWVSGNQLSSNSLWREPGQDWEPVPARAYTNMQ